MAALAQEAANDARPAELSAELAALLAAQPKWSTWAAAEAAAGYKDNLLLSHVDEERSAFARGGVQFLLLRAPTSPLDFSFFGQAGGTHYFSGETIDQEANVWSQAEFGYRLGRTWKFALDVRGYYDDRVFDVSDSDIERLVAALRVTGFTVAPNVRWTLNSAWWAEAEGVATREKFHDGVNDRRIGQGSVRLGWRRGNRVELSLRAARRWQNYEYLPLYSAAGRELANTHRKIAEREGELRCDLAWDAAARWKTSTRARVSDYVDNGSGYFDTREKRLSQEVAWTGENWLVRVEGAAARVDYGVQTIGFGIAPPRRLKDEFSAELMVERKLSKRWTLLGNYSWERIRSNDLVASYVVNEGLLGVRWSWEK